MYFYHTRTSTYVKSCNLSRAGRYVGPNSTTTVPLTCRLASCVSRGVSLLGAAWRFWCGGCLCVVSWARDVRVFFSVRTGIRVRSYLVRVFLFLSVLFFSFLLSAQILPFPGCRYRGCHGQFSWYEHRCRRRVLFDGREARLPYVRMETNLRCWVTTGRTGCFSYVQGRPMLLCRFRTKTNEKKRNDKRNSDDTTSSAHIPDTDKNLLTYMTG